MLQFELTDHFVGPKLFKTRKVFNENTRKIASLEFDNLMRENRWDLIFCWMVVAVPFNLDIGDAIHDLHDEIADHKRDLDLLIEG